MSPRPHKNISTLKLKYQSQAFSKVNSHSKTMDINRVGKEALAMVERPRVLQGLKQSSIRFSGSQEMAQGDRDFIKKMIPYL